MKYWMFVVGLSAFLLSACGSNAVPALDPSQLEATGVSQASTLVALTEATFPTETPTSLPPTLEFDTPTPLFTVTPLADQLTTGQLILVQPSQAAGPTPTAGPEGQNIACLQPLDLSGSWSKHEILIKNESGGTLNLSLDMVKPNQAGQCGSLTFAGVAGNGSLMAELPAGDWFMFAYGTTSAANVQASGSFSVQPELSARRELCLRAGSMLFEPSC